MIDHGRNERSFQTKCDVQLSMRRMIDFQKIFCKIFDTIQLSNDSFKWFISLMYTCEIIGSCTPLFRILHCVWGSVDQFDKSDFLKFCVYFFVNVFDFGLFVNMANRIAVEANNVANAIFHLHSNNAASDELQNLVS